MSSNGYFAELRPDPVLRRLVLGSGALLATAGSLGCLYLPLAVPARACAALAWAVTAGREAWRLHRAWQACTAFRIAAGGEVAVRGRDGCWRPATLLDGGVLLRRWGWVRLRAPSGRVFAEPVRGSCRDGQDWRRLQVIWRHVGAPE